MAALRLAEYYWQSPIQGLLDSLHGQKLLQLGLAADLDYCSKLNHLTNVPVFFNDKIL
ncbi:hypothetical protein N752_05130 [Desulforamulus aquiferis]|nr:hypothetical protein N752_05130 [Desulforamulus aquiferis]